MSIPGPRAWRESRTLNTDAFMVETHASGDEVVLTLCVYASADIVGMHISPDGAITLAEALTRAALAACKQSEGER